MEPRKAAERRGAMILRTLSSSTKYRHLTLLAKAALPLLWAWSDDQGRIAVDPDALKMRALLSLKECSEEQVPALFEEYDKIGWGKLYEYEPGRRACQWFGWKDAQILRTYHPSDLPSPEGWQDIQRSVTEESWYQQRQQERQIAKEEGILDKKGGGQRQPAPQDQHPADEIEVLRARYSPEQRKWIDEALSSIRQVKPPTELELAVEMRKWDRYPPDIVASAAQQFVAKLYHKDGHGLEYLSGIVKRWENGEQPKKPRETQEEKRTSLITLLLNQAYGVPKGADEPALKQFKAKLLDLIVGDGLKRIDALRLIKALKVEEWYELNDQEEVERRIRVAIKAQRGAAV